jgi:sulfonate transport system substrate-binding protein
MKRRDLLTFAGAFASASVFPSLVRAGDLPAEIRIGYQKSGVLAVAKQLGLIEKRYTPQNIAVRWVEFPYGPPLMEALGAGRLDYGYTGNAPPIFAQAAKAPFLYVAAFPAHGGNVGLVVPANSPVKNLADLKGKTVGVARGSSGHDLLVAAVESVNLNYSDIKPVYLAPADGASAFSRGAIDAWSIWDPFLAIAESAQPVRRLKVGDQAAFQNAFFLANRDFTEKYPAVVTAINDDVAKAAAYARDHRDEAAVLFAKDTGVSLDIEKTVVARTDFLVTPINDAIVTQQQGVADRFARINLIPAPVTVTNVIWKWTPAG